LLLCGERLGVMNWWRLTGYQVLLSQRVFWQDIAFALIGALMPVAMALAPVLGYANTPTRAGSVPVSVFLLPGGMAATSVWIMYTAINSAARRRDTLNYKRLRATPLPDSSILCGEAASAALPAIGQAVIVLVLGMEIVHAPLPRNVLVIGAGLLLAAATFALLSFGISGLLPSGEVSTWIITPFVFALWFASGAIAPLSDFPRWIGDAAHYLPSTAAVEIFRTGYFAKDYVLTASTAAASPTLSFFSTIASCWRPALVLLAWAFLGALMWRRLFRWDPRHSK
jgi:ABC-2 type transport system permease protein